ncbi:hypothetical protein OHA18_27865 [Kribbella sp. NBC_00709]|uniref:hypothetical protein n=1 Tax=Kribbella sp. NBC_00709 TaxID=2975972 RepID=UPI002E2B5287|nr:hypothetical protein [Kribbella sp. NBC_00709]
MLDDYDVGELDVLVFGGMVPAETKEYLKAEIGRRNAGITVLQGLVGIPGVLAAQVDAATRENESAVEVEYDEAERIIRVTLPDDVRVTVEALWMTSWTPPEPTTTSSTVFDGELVAGSHDIALPERVPTEGSFAVVRAGDEVRAFAVGPMPKALARMVPKSASDHRLPEVASVTTREDLG